MKKLLVTVLSAVLVCGPVLAGIPSGKAQFVGGTITSIPQQAIGSLSTTDPKFEIFAWGKEGDKLQIPYANITSLAYGQHAGRRVGAAVAWGVTTLGVMALPILFSKKRRHYLTIEYTDDKGQGQAAIFQVGKNAICTVLTTLEVRTGKKVEYENDDARKAGCH